MLGLLKVIAAAALALVLWLMISEAVVRPAAQQEPPRPPEPIPKSTALTTTPTTPATPTAPATAADIAKLNDNITKLTAIVDRLSQQLGVRDAPAKPGQSSAATDPPRRREIDPRQTWRRQSWRDSACWW